MFSKHLEIFQAAQIQCMFYTLTARYVHLTDWSLSSLIDHPCFVLFKLSSCSAHIILDM